MFKFNINENDYQVKEESIEDKLICLLLKFNINELTELIDKSLVDKEIIHIVISLKEYYETMEDQWLK